MSRVPEPSLDVQVLTTNLVQQVIFLETRVSDEEDSAHVVQALLNAAALIAAGQHVVTNRKPVDEDPLMINTVCGWLDELLSRKVDLARSHLAENEKAAPGKAVPPRRILRKLRQAVGFDPKPHPED